MRFSANLGFLWAELPLPDAIGPIGRFLRRTTLRKNEA